tara:strand:+ start:170 stop:991 length:822 start_codon:yes stop_codon:yes gene_type:complete
MNHVINKEIEISLPDELGDMPEAYNTEWDQVNGQGWEMKNFLKHTKNRSSLLDVGGNVGWFSYMFQLNNNDDNKKFSFCFEPSPEGARLFKMITEYNENDNRFGDPMLVMYPLFVGDVHGEVEFLLEEQSHTLCVRYERESPQFKVDTQGKDRSITTMVTLDEFSKWVMTDYEVPTIPDTFKIDVEGYEYRVLMGAKKAINDLRPWIFLEIHQRLLKMYNNHIVNIYDLLMELEYDIYNLHEQPVTSKNAYFSLFGEKSEIRCLCIPKEEKGL